MSNEIGFIGLGALGLPMAENLLGAGFKLRVYNRTPSKADPLLKRGAALQSNSASTASSGGIAISMLADDEAVEGLVIGDDTIAHRLAPGGVHISMSTISPSCARRLAEFHVECGSTYVAAPVFGRPDAAKAKRLWIVVSGSADAKHKARPALDAMGQQVIDFGSDPTAAHTVKLASNFMIAAAMEAIAEGLTMAERGGVDRVKLAEMLTSTIFASPVYQGYGPMIAEMRHSPVGFRLELGLKDLDLVLKTATEVRSPMPFASIIRDRFLSAIAKGRGDLDWSAMALGARDDAGLGEKS